MGDCCPPTGLRCGGIILPLLRLIVVVPTPPLNVGGNALGVAVADVPVGPTIGRAVDDGAVEPKVNASSVSGASGGTVPPIPVPVNSFCGGGGAWNGA